MLEKTPLIQAFKDRHFDEALRLLNEGEKLPPATQSYDLSIFYDQLIRDKGFDVLIALAERGSIKNDIYDYDRFSDSIYHNIFKVNEPAEKLLEALNILLASAENVQDEVEGHTLLSYALDQGAHPLIIKTLIDAGLDSSFRNNAEDTLLHSVVKYNRVPADRQLAYVNLLLDEGADVNATNIVKKTALHMAIESNKKDLLAVLLQHGTQPNDVDAEGNSAFFYAIAHKFDLGIYEQLAAYDSIDFDQRNRYGVGALHEYLRMLTSSYESNPELLIRLLQDGADLRSYSPHYHVPKSGWQWVAEKDPIVLEVALKVTGADVNESDDKGNTLLHYVCALDCNHDQKVAENIYKKVKILLDHGADPSLVNTDEKRALDLASNDNLKSKTVELLLTQSK